MALYTHGSQALMSCSLQGPWTPDLLHMCPHSSKAPYKIKILSAAAPSIAAALCQQALASYKQHVLCFQRVCWEVPVEALLYLQHCIHQQLQGVDGLVGQP